MLGRCLGDALCLRVLILLIRASMTVPELATTLRDDRRKVQLRVDWLSEAGFVGYAKCGRYRCYLVRSEKRQLLDSLLESYRESLAWSETLTLDQKRLRVCARATFHPLNPSEFAG